MREMTLRDIQMVSLDILKQVHKFCCENGIRYSLAYGTLIGAIRHKGFIPWDDDLDIMMPRPDYDRFCKTFRAQGYEVVSRYNRPDCMIPFARVCDTERTSISTLAPWIREQGNLGIWIDIFPVDSVSDDPEQFRKTYLLSRKLQDNSVNSRKAMRPFTADMPFNFNLNTLKKKIFYLFMRSPETILDEKEKVTQAFPYGSTRHVSQLAFTGIQLYLDADIMNHYKAVPFEDSEFYVLEDYDTYLRTIYGDYMQLPPEKDRHPLQTYIKFRFKD